ncbi:carcinoembryonic antigen-related cell adhesion molecule 10-like isoform X3 [Apodemus sylvaticus]|uniref:carcinoembryonic antigen-related cell adhesion molecule 10-like isoform X3 n=1 Tax=Apodemus sylvaticus TaxID=10129 RepID=UPI002242AEFA|nr:carcinoembryonic antigen-related cell adhesion molecule 10-like isoform X3 [Apodemus sylvaticus]
MELASAHGHRGQIPWRGLLLTASLLTSWSPPTTAQVTVEAVPPIVAEGKNVLLLVHNLPQTFQVFYWYNGTTTTDVNNEIGRFVTQTNQITMGPASNGRETIYTNGSLFIQSVTKNDEGVYTLDIIDPDYEHSYPRVHFSVHASLSTSWSPPTTAQVTIEAVPSQVAEGKDVLLLVQNLPRAIQAFYWYKGTTADGNNEITRFIRPINKSKMGPAHSGRETIYSNGSLFFQNVTKNDEGAYTLLMLDQNFETTHISVQFSVRASLLTSWSPPTTAQVTVEAVPPTVAEGKDVLLLVQNLPRAIQAFYWYKGTTTDGNNEIGRFITPTNKITMGPASSGREKIYSNGFLFFQRVTKNDEGAYTLLMLDQNFETNHISVRFSVHR